MFVPEPSTFLDSFVPDMFILLLLCISAKDTGVNLTVIVLQELVFLWVVRDSI